jgi:hypothetical protein
MDSARINETPSDMVLSRDFLPFLLSSGMSGRS